ncbi:uncharacterized protein LOC126838286 [Adelges cooleyi]|uniref:uncharacterized protein LOC126838286 n=1 Tax=Adelges cooleyi TaxID=133065 RepID=UPI0021806D6C|nr:uncharacterized protein LOC126838286 [Adelges cooleyi]
MSSTHSQVFENELSTTFINNVLVDRFKETEENIVYCTLCNLIVPNTLKEKKSHWKSCTNRRYYNIINNDNNNISGGFQCYPCKFDINTLTGFRNHIMTESHTTKCHGVILYSYLCIACSMMIYAPCETINKHMKDKHKQLYLLPRLSYILNSIMTKFEKTKALRFYYACVTCKSISPCRIKHQLFHSDTMFYCDTCNIVFCCSDCIYKRHTLSYEHNLFWIKSNSNTIVDNSYLMEFSINLPRCIKRNFVALPDDFIRCKICGVSCTTNEGEIMNHLESFCVHQPDLTGRNFTNIDTFKCLICDELHNDFNLWKCHVVSKQHLVRCHNAGNVITVFDDKTLWCVINKTDATILTFADNQSGEISLLSMCMARVLEDQNCGLDTFYYYYDHISGNFGRLREKLQSSSYYCDTCKISFFCTSDLFNKHSLTSEHIFLRYIGNIKNVENREYPKLISPLNTSDTSPLKVSNLCTSPIYQTQKTRLARHFKIKIETLNSLMQYKDQVIDSVRAVSFYCTDCDYVTNEDLHWKDHNEQHYSNSSSGALPEQRIQIYCDVCSIYMVGLKKYIDKHKTTEEHIALNKLFRALKKVESNIAEMEESLQSSSNINDDKSVNKKSENKTTLPNAKSTSLHNLSTKIPKQSNQDRQPCSTRDALSSSSLVSTDDQYLLYVAQRFQQIQDDTVKFKIKLAIDQIFCKNISLPSDL